MVGRGLGGGGDRLGDRKGRRLGGGRGGGRRRTLPKARDRYSAALLLGSCPLDLDDETGDRQDRIGIQQPKNDAALHDRGLCQALMRESAERSSGSDGPSQITCAVWSLIASPVWAWAKIVRPSRLSTSQGMTLAN